MTPAKKMIRGMIHAQLLPAPGVDLTPDERRAIRNKLKTLRKRHAR